MKVPRWMRRKGISWLDLIKVLVSIGTLTFLVSVMLLGAIGTIVS